jgi:hypothetical protein
MKKMILLSLLLLPCFALASVTTIKIKDNETKPIYLNLYKFQELNKNAQIPPVTCFITTKYDGNIRTITFSNLIDSNNKPISNSQFVSKNHPVREYIAGRFTTEELSQPNPVLLFWNYHGCSIAKDGQKCTDAKNMGLDNIIVTCTQQDN